MDLRRLNKADSESLFLLRLRALESEPAAFGSSVEDEMAKGISFFENILSMTGPDNVVFGTFVDCNLIGMAGVQRHPRLKTKHKAGIWGMYVDRNYRGKGIGAALLDLTVRHAKEEMKVELVTLSVESSNLAAKGLYRSRLFKTWGVEPKSMMIDSQYYDEEHMLLQF